MNRCEIISLNESHNDDMLSIVSKSPIKANGMEICFDKSPDIFAITRMKYSQSAHLGFFIDGILKGFGSLGFFEANVQGERQQIFTVYNFYVLPEARGKGFPAMALRQFMSLARMRANFGISLTMKGNKPAESYIGRNLGNWMPPTRVIDEWVVNSIPILFPKKNESVYSVRNATINDVPEVVGLLNKENSVRDFGSMIDESNFLSKLQAWQLKTENYFVATDRGGRIKGVCLAWDCNSFRRTKVLQYSFAFYPAIFLNKVLERFLPVASLPAKGETFRELTITDYAVADRNPSIMHALLVEIYRRHQSQKYHFLTWGSCGSDDLLEATKGFWHQQIRSHLIFTSIDPGLFEIKSRLPYLDIAFL